METMLQPKILGYRQLSEEEVALINEGKALAEQVGEYTKKLQEYQGIRADGTAPTLPGMLVVLDKRMINIGATNLQLGFMAIIRGIAKPNTF